MLAQPKKGCPESSAVSREHTHRCSVCDAQGLVHEAPCHQCGRHSASSHPAPCSGTRSREPHDPVTELRCATNAASLAQHVALNPTRAPLHGELEHLE